MKSTLKIARTELRTLFYSPVAWLVLIVFIIQTGLDFTDMLAEMQTWAAVGAKVPGLTEILFSGKRGVITAVENRLFLYLPFLTMGLIGREKSSGSIKLLFSSPVTIGEIVLGKLLAMLIYCLLLISILFVFVQTTILYLPHADIGLMFSGMLGIFLMCAVYSSIGLFMSSLSSYQPVAALYTFTALAFLNFIGSIGQNMDWMRHIASFLAINGRAHQIVTGLISTRQLSYFLVMSGLFTLLTVLKLSFERRPRALWIRVASYSSLALAAIFLIGFFSMPSLTAYFDLTQTKSQTIAKSSQEVLEKMPQVKVHTYVNLLGDDAYHGLPQSRNADHNFYDQYQRFLKNDILVDYVYYYDSLDPGAHLFKENPGISMKDLAENVADGMGFNIRLALDSDAIRKVIDLRPWHNRFMRQFESGGKSTMLGLFLDGPSVPKEQEMMDALNLMKTPKQHVAFLTGHNERVAEEDGTRDRDYNLRMNTSTMRQSIVNHGFDFREISIDSLEIPKDISLLIVSDPMLPLKRNELLKVQQYIAEGRNIWILGEPARKELTSPLINPLGVRYMDGMLLAECDDRGYAPDFLINFFAPEAANYSPVLRQLLEDSAHLTTHGAVALTYDSNGPFQIEPFIVTDPSNTWNRIGPFDSTAKKISYDPAQGDRKGTYAVAVTLQRSVNNRKQRIMVAGDADMLSDGEWGGVEKKLWELNGEIFKWFSYGEFPKDIFHPSGPDKIVTISGGGIRWIRMILLFFIPGILLTAGGLLLLIRRRR